MLNRQNRRQPEGPAYRMEAENGLLVSVPEEKRKAWEEAQAKRPPEKCVQRLKDMLLSEIYGSSRQTR